MKIEMTAIAHIGIISIHWGYIGIMERKMEIIMGLYRAYDLGLMHAQVRAR